MSKDQKCNKRISITPQDRTNNIIFERKGTNNKAKLGIKIIIYFILSGIIGALIASVIIKYKYSEFFAQLETVINNEDMIILDYTKIIEEVSPSLVSISDSPEKLTSNSYFENNVTGVIIDESGIVLTNYSAIKGNEEIYVKLSSLVSQPIKAELLIESEEIDLAIIKIKFDGELKPIKVADKDEVYEGQGIVILGNAIGDEYIGSSIPGIITSKNEKISFNDNRSYSLLQINAPINKSNTGGAICNGKGELVGIANLSVTDQKSEPGLYYGLLMEGLNEIITSTDSFKKILGIIEGGIVIDESKNFRGFYIQEVDKNGSAYKAGIKPTDIIIKINGKDVVNVEDIILSLKDKSKDDIIICSVLSDGEIKEFKIKIL